jgi:hypothetical protein
MAARQHLHRLSRRAREQPEPEEPAESMPVEPAGKKQRRKKKEQRTNPEPVADVARLAGSQTRQQFACMMHCAVSQSL